MVSIKASCGCHKGWFRLRPHNPLQPCEVHWQKTHGESSAKRFKTKILPACITSSCHM